MLLLAVVFSGVCLWINLYVAPRALQNLKDSFFQVATSNPTAAFTGDQVINDFPGKKIFVGNRKTGNQARKHPTSSSLDDNNKPVRSSSPAPARSKPTSEHKQIKMNGWKAAAFEQRDFTSGPMT